MGDVSMSMCVDGFVGEWVCVWGCLCVWVSVCGGYGGVCVWVGSCVWVWVFVGGCVNEWYGLHMNGICNISKDHMRYKMHTLFLFLSISPVLLNNLFYQLYYTVLCKYIILYFLFFCC